MVKHLVPIMWIGTFVCLLYSSVSGAYFCGYDDFLEVHRAAFADSKEPVKMLTTTHFGSPKYRPLNRLATYVTWHLGHGPLAFRIRNLLFHVLCMASVYGIAWLLYRQRQLAIGAALLFGIHPLANQTVVVASWPSTITYGLLALTFFLFLLSLEAGARWKLNLTGVFVLVLTAVLLYEASIAIFGVLFCYLLLHWYRGRGLPRYYLAMLGGIAGSIALLQAVLRHIFVSNAMPIATIPVLARNVAMYVGAMLMPVDAVLANTLFGTPLPSEWVFTTEIFAIAAGVLILILAAAAAPLLRPAVRQRLRNIDWLLVLVLAVCCVATLLPFLVFAPHPSETYLYFPLVMFAVLLSALLWHALPSRRAHAIVVGLIAISYTAGVWARNRRVVACGTVAQKILTALPASHQAEGAAYLRLAVPESESMGTPYGIYNWHGLATIEPPGNGVPFAKMAVQLASGNEQIQVEVVPSQLFVSDCEPPMLCYLVGAAGDVNPVVHGQQR
jgi:hypothetical protein